MSDGRYQIVRYKSHCSLYRGFNIYKLPRNKTRKVTQYRVALSNGYDGQDSFGLFDALAEATQFIDSLFSGRNK